MQTTKFEYVEMRSSRDNMNGVNSGLVFVSFVTYGTAQGHPVLGTLSTDSKNQLI